MEREQTGENVVTYLFVILRNTHVCKTVTKDALVALEIPCLAAGCTVKGSIKILGGDPKQEGAYIIEHLFGFLDKCDRVIHGHFSPGCLGKVNVALANCLSHCSEVFHKFGAAFPVWAAFFKNCREMLVVHSASTSSNGTGVVNFFHIEGQKAKRSLHAFLSFQDKRLDLVAFHGSMVDVPPTKAEVAIVFFEEFISNVTVWVLYGMPQLAFLLLTVHQVCYDLQGYGILLGIGVDTKNGGKSKLGVCQVGEQMVVHGWHLVELVKHVFQMFFLHFASSSTIGTTK